MGWRRRGGLLVSPKLFFWIAKHPQEYLIDFNPSQSFLNLIKQAGVDVYTFIERTFLGKERHWNFKYVHDNVALMKIYSHDYWWKKIAKSSRWAVRKAVRKGVTIRIEKPTEQLALEIWKIYNETPIRQGRGFPHYGESYESVLKGILRNGCLSVKTDRTLLGAYYKGRLIGFMIIDARGNVGVITQFLSYIAHRDKAPNNALISEAVKVCEEKGIRYLIYARMGNHPSLDLFKYRNGFRRFILPRYYIPITWRGSLALKIGIYRDLVDAIPQGLKYPLIPVVNALDRFKTRCRLLLRPTPWTATLNGT